MTKILIQYFFKNAFHWASAHEFNSNSVLYNFITNWKILNVLVNLYFTIYSDKRIKYISTPFFFKFEYEEQNISMRNSIIY